MQPFSELCRATGLADAELQDLLGVSAAFLAECRTGTRRASPSHEQVLKGMALCGPPNEARSARESASVHNGRRTTPARQAPPGGHTEMLRENSARQLTLLDSASASTTRPKRKSPDGIATSAVLLSAHVGRNADLFPKILDLHVPPGSRIADVTWGKGVFWQQVEHGRYHVDASDIQTGIDCRNLPYKDGSYDCVVLDPPYMEGLFRHSSGHLAGAGKYAPFRNNYSDGKATTVGPKYHACVLDLYFRAGREAHRVLREEGILLVKCQDEVSANQQNLTHVEIINEYAGLGFYAKDLFVLVRTNRPAMSRVIRQEHARKNHSYFIVFVKLAPGRSRRRSGKARARKAAAKAR
jgi:hypothetical protein